MTLIQYSTKVQYTRVSYVLCYLIQREAYNYLNSEIKFCINVHILKVFFNGLYIFERYIFPLTFPCHCRRCLKMYSYSKFSILKISILNNLSK